MVAQFFTPIQNFLLKLSNKLDYFGNILNDFFLQKYKNDSSLLRMDLNATNRNMQCKRILKIFFGAEEEKKMMILHFFRRSPRYLAENEGEKRISFRYERFQ